MSIEFLQRSDRVYQAMRTHAQRLLANGRAEAALRWVDLAASFASWEGAPGRYSDGALENVALDVGESLECLIAGEEGYGDEFPERADPAARQRQVLHIATQAFSLGGHTRLIETLVHNDTDSRHSLLLTRQGSDPVPAGLAAAFDRSGGMVWSLPAGMNPIMKSWRLRQAAESGFDAVILHHHAGDAIPIAAFALSDGPPVAVMNHADHVFWLGPSIADAVISIRPTGLKLSESRRQSRQNFLLPISLTPPAHFATRAEARAALGIPADRTVLLSIGSAYKYAPTATHNFFRTAFAVLEQHPDAHLYLVGVSDDAQADPRREYRHERMHLVGYIENQQTLAHYHAAADLYLEGFPFGSLTALLEAAQRGLSVVPALAQASAVLTSDDVAFEGIIDNPTHEQDYVERVGSLINDRQVRESLGLRLSESIAAHHTGAGWQEYLERVYESLAQTKHAPAPIEPTACEATDDDLNLAAITERRDAARRALPLSLAQRKQEELGLADLRKLFSISVATGETPRNPLGLRPWVRLIGRRAVPRRAAKAN